MLTMLSPEQICTNATILIGYFQIEITMNQHLICHFYVTATIQIAGYTTSQFEDMQSTIDKTTIKKVTQKTFSRLSHFNMLIILDNLVLMVEELNNESTRAEKNMNNLL